MSNKRKSSRKRMKGLQANGQAIGGEGLIFDYHTIRLIIGVIAMIFIL